MRTLVISDIHHRHVQAQILIDNVPCDRIVLLGDYFDSFGDSVCDANNTAIWLKEMVLSNPKITPLFGNHDQSYIWSWNHNAHCSGYKESKRNAIRRILNHEDFKKLKAFTVDQGYVLSHAGLTGEIWKEYKNIDRGPTSLDVFISDLQKLVDRNIHIFEICGNPPLFNAGWDRDGTQRHGGLTWVDWKSFVPVNGINQIVGHTIQPEVKILIQYKLGNIKSYSAKLILRKKNPFKNATSINDCLDTNLNNYAVIEDGAVTIYDSSTREPIVDELATKLSKQN
jgi:hypothetical protein